MTRSGTGVGKAPRLDFCYNSTRSQGRDLNFRASFYRAVAGYTVLHSEHKIIWTGKKTALFQEQMLKLERSMEEGRERIIVSRARQEFTHVSLVNSFMANCRLALERMMWSLGFTFLVK